MKREVVAQVIQPQLSPFFAFRYTYCGKKYLDYFNVMSWLEVLVREYQKKTSFIPSFPCHFNSKMAQQKKMTTSLTTEFLNRHHPLYAKHISGC